MERIILPLNENLSCEKICSQIKKLLESTNNFQDKILVISISNSIQTVQEIKKLSVNNPQ